HALDRVDKHRLVLTVTMTTTAWGVDVLGNRFMFPLIVSGPLIADDELVNVPTRTVKGTGKENFKLGLDITFGQSEIVAGKPVLETLNRMADFASAIIPQFEPFLL
ncbi:MAG TPA: hypothetical protein VEI54_08950, partial [Candidatus Limnocylindrales bacterium]|nr:hypothetical protein [Candidatus Limnocylindrales bacterium]